MRRGDLLRLHDISALKSDMALEDLRRVQTRYNSIESRLEALRAERVAAQDAMQIGEESGAFAAVAHFRWLEWSEAEKGRLNIELAAASALVDIARKQAAEGVGRKDVVEKLIARATPK